MYHCCLDVSGALRMSDRDLLGWFPRMAPSAARTVLALEQMKGVKVVRIGPCDNFDPVKGCMGHPESAHKESGNAR